MAAPSSFPPTMQRVLAAQPTHCSECQKMNTFSPLENRTMHSQITVQLMQGALNNSSQLKGLQSSLPVGIELHQGKVKTAEQTLADDRIATIHTVARHVALSMHAAKAGQPIPAPDPDASYLDSLKKYFS